MLVSGGRHLSTGGREGGRGEGGREEDKERQ